MKKIVAVMMCCLLVALSGCSGGYQRTIFEDCMLEEKLAQHIDENTKVVNTSDESFPDRLPVYWISERRISDKEYRQMIKQLGIENERDIDHRGNVINGTIKDFHSDDFEDFNLTDEELEKLAWETFGKLPFIEGTYEYCGITSDYTLSDSTGTHLVRVGVSFRRTLDGIQIRGDDQCDLYFDNTGLVEIYVELYNYTKIGNMAVVSLESASSKIKNPDSFSIDTKNSAQWSGVADTLRVERNELVFYNQDELGCTVLQPVYRFAGTAADADGTQAKFNAIVIAIPDTYTYESE